MILIIGSQEETHAEYVYNALKKRGTEVEYFDTREYPQNILLSYSENTEGYLIINGKKINISDIQGVYWRWHYGIPYKKYDDEFVSNMVLRERTSALNSFLCSLKCNVVNPFEAIEMHKNKAYQLNLLKNAGIRVPKTVITNDKASVLDFYEKNNKNVIYKPVLGGASTQKLTDEDLTEDRLKELQDSPIQLQECIDGVDIRVFAMGNYIYAAEIRANTLDFRDDNQAELCPVEIPETAKADCIKALELLKLKYSGIDIRKTKDDEYVFIEANPAPMFIHFERMTKYPITEELIRLLTQ